MENLPVRSCAGHPCYGEGIISKKKPPAYATGLNRNINFFKQIIVFIFFLFNTLLLTGQDMTLKVWPEGAPNHNGMNEPEEKFNGKNVRKVSEAEMYVFLPEKAVNTGAAVVICPGGGYRMEAMSHEGYEMARWLAGKGITGVVLKYRLPYGHHEIPSGDARQAIRIVRKNAVDWGIDPEKVGIAGSSAGGHLASTVGTRFDSGDANSNDPVKKMSCRPDFMLLLYPVITFREEFGHMGSRKNLIGEGNDREMVYTYSNEFHITPQTPPAFIVLAHDDKTVSPRNSVEFYLALNKNKVPSEMHIYQEGGHGFGMNKLSLPVDQWPDLFYNWLKAIQIIK